MGKKHTHTQIAHRSIDRSESPNSDVEATRDGSGEMIVREEERSCMSAIQLRRRVARAVSRPDPRHLPLSMALHCY